MLSFLGPETQPLRLNAVLKSSQHTYIYIQTNKCSTSRVWPNLSITRMLTQQWVPSNHSALGKGHKPDDYFWQVDVFCLT